MAFLSRDELLELGFKSVGSNVLLSSKASIYNPERIEIGNNVKIDDFCILSGNVKIGNNVHLATYNLLAGGINGIEMKDFSGLAYRCQVFTQSDDYTGELMTNPTVPEKYRLVDSKKVTIGRHCIIGTATTIFPGVNIADGCSVGAMSLVNKDTEEWGIYRGIPARRVGERSKKLLELEDMYLSETI